MPTHACGGVTSSIQAPLAASAPLLTPLVQPRATYYATRLSSRFQLPLFCFIGIFTLPFVPPLLMQALCPPRPELPVLILGLLLTF
jgi:hypothetical protein